MSLRRLANCVATCVFLGACAAQPTSVEPVVSWEEAVPLEASKPAGRSKLADLSTPVDGEAFLHLLHVSYSPWVTIPQLGMLSSRVQRNGALADARTLFQHASTYVWGQGRSFLPPACAAEQAAVSWYVLQMGAPREPAQITANSGLIQSCRVEPLRSAKSPLAELVAGLVLGYRTCDAVHCEPGLRVPGALRLLTPRAQWSRVGKQRHATDDDALQPFSIVDVPVVRGETSAAVITLTSEQIARWRTLRGESQLDADQMLLGPMPSLLVRVEVEWLESEEVPTVRTSVSAYGEPGRAIAKWLGLGTTKGKSK
jgi:hypothetical protein